LHAAQPGGQNTMIIQPGNHFLRNKAAISSKGLSQPTRLWAWFPSAAVKCMTKLGANRLDQSNSEG